MPKQPKKRPRAPHQLPPGRNRLSRVDVEANQRQRIMDAIVDVASLAGFSSMSVEEITGTAGVSRRTFYDHFRSKDEAFLRTIDAVSDDLVEGVSAAYQAADTFPGAIRDGLGAFLKFLADEPRYADLLIVEILAAGPEAIARRNRVMNEFARMVREGAARQKNARQPPELAAETIIGGIYEVVFSRVLQGETTRLPKLLPDLAYSMMQPYLGDEVARRESVKPPNLVADAEAAA